MNPSPKAQKYKHCGLTLIELLILLTVIALLVGIALPALAQARTKAHRITCVGRLKNIGLANRIFATDHSDRFPYAFFSNRIDLASLTAADYYRWLSNGLSTPIILICPADNARRAATSWIGLHATNISYFAGLAADETALDSILAGDRNLVANSQPLPSGLARGTNLASLAWGRDLHREHGHVATGDGSVQQLSSARLDASRTNFLHTGEYLLLVP